MLSVAGLSSGGAIEAPYFTATSTAATSTFAGGLSVGTCALTVLQNGNVGIGTSSPNLPVVISSVYSTVGTAPFSFVNTGDAARSGSFTASVPVGFTNTIPLVLKIATSTTGILNAMDFVMLNTSGGDNSFARIGAIASNATPGSLAADFAIQTRTAGSITEKLRVTSSGNVGIGTTTPWARLSVDASNLSTSPAFVIGSSTATNFIVTNGGNVGIGTTTPQTKLEVSDNAAPTLRLDLNNVTGYSEFTDGATELQISKTTDAAGALIGFNPSPASGTNAAQVRFFRFTNTTGTRSVLFMRGDGTGTIDAQIGVGSSNSFFNSGNVGIGTTTPATTFSVVGNGYFTGGVGIGAVNTAANSLFVSRPGLSATTIVGTTTLDQLNFSTSNGIIDVANQPLSLKRQGGAADAALVFFDSTNNLASRLAALTGGGLRFTNGNGATEWARFTSTGNVGIGTTTPWGKLSVTNTGTGPSLVVEDSTSPDITPFIIDASGNVGIGTTTPSYELDVAGTGLSSFLRGRSDDHQGGRISLENANNSFARFGLINDDLLLESGNGSTVNGILTMKWNTGNVGVATSTPWRVLSVTGTVGFDGLTGATGAGSLCLDSNKQVVYNSASDSCLSSTRETKHDIQPLSLDALGMIEGLEPVSFVYNEGNDRTRFGFIAEDTAAIDSHLATYNASGTVSGIDDRAILSVLVSAIKALSAKLADLAQTVASFAESFTTKELTFDRAYGHELTVDKLCVGQVCVTESQFMAVFSASAAAASPISVPSSPSNIREVAPPESASSTSTPDTAPATPEAPTTEPEDDEPQTEEISASVTPDAANDNEAAATLPTTEPASAAQ